MSDEPKRIGSELDLLMSMDPLELSKNPEAIDKIIEYERKARLEFEMGVKTPKKDQGVAIDIGKIVGNLTAALPQQTMARRKL
jgi:hypothetical protein